MRHISHPIIGVMLNKKTGKYHCLMVEENFEGLMTHLDTQMFKGDIIQYHLDEYGSREALVEDMHTKFSLLFTECRVVTRGTFEWGGKGHPSGWLYFDVDDATDEFVMVD
jgi:hypothetical protein